ncbi:MAG: hypothetical protein KGY80_13545 [Candidatus Thorarchaeota archaeon]|nr:hypothetical protein [Candidatus Thorarchaeota archaeon]
MKQYWRIGTIRSLASLALGMLVLGRKYLEYVPYLSGMGVIGALTLGSALFLIFLGLGWLYDVKAKMWSQKLQVAIERNPYQYIPNIKACTMDYPVLYAIILYFKRILNNLDISTGKLDQLVIYLEDYFSRQTDRSDILSAEEKAEAFLDEEPFIDSGASGSKLIPLSSKAKLAWETQVLRVNWIQSLTGLLQDVLIFGVLYVQVIFPWVSEEQTLVVGVGVISLPFLVILLLLGWVYDRRLKVWAADREVKIDRNPYSYVLQPSERSFNAPFMYAFLDFLTQVSDNLGINKDKIRVIAEYFEKYLSLRASNNEDLAEARKLRQEYGSLFRQCIEER